MTSPCPAALVPASTVVQREMGVTHAEFFRILPAVVSGFSWRREGGTVTVDDQGRRLIIRIGPERERRLGLLALPVTDVELEFRNWPSAGITDFMDHFDLRFRRGGG